MTLEASPRSPGPGDHRRWHVCATYLAPDNHSALSRDTASKLDSAQWSEQPEPIEQPIAHNSFRTRKRTALRAIRPIVIMKHPAQVRFFLPKPFTEYFI